MGTEYDDQSAEAGGGNSSLALEGATLASLGQLLRESHRAFARALQGRIAIHGVTMGQWSFLVALWEEDGITQRQLSQRVGMMEPTTVTALNGMERAGLVTRVRNDGDRRKFNIFLTDKGRALRATLLPHAEEVARLAIAGASAEEIAAAQAILDRVIENLGRSETDESDGLA